MESGFADDIAGGDAQLVVGARFTTMSAVADGFAVRLGRIGARRFRDADALARYLPERATHLFALHPARWEATFHSLTCKDPRKIKYYRPTLVRLTADTIIADMLHANRLYWATTDAERVAAARACCESARMLTGASLRDFALPELFVPTDRSVAVSESL